MSGFEVPYEVRRNPNLPWGYWLTIDNQNWGEPIVDEEGNRWQSIRHALWSSRLRMGHGPQLSPEAKEQLEFLLSVLAAISRSIVSITETVIDLFGGRWHLAAHYGEWLAGQGLITRDSGLKGAKLTPEGQAILVALASTRDPALAARPLGFAGLMQFAALKPDPDDIAIERMIGKAEAALPQLHCQFVRHEIGNDPAIVLLGRANAQFPMRETIWSITFGSAHERDLLYLWILARADRWERWVDIVGRQSAQALTEHLLVLRVAEDSYPANLAPG